MIKAARINLKRYFGITVIPLLMSWLIDCSSYVYQYRTLEVHIPAGINVDENEIRQRLAPLRLSVENGFTLKITVYGFSQGAEIINFTDGDQFSTKNGKAWIKALVQVKRGEEIVRADFIEVTGNGREELLDRFGSVILEVTGNK